MKQLGMEPKAIEQSQSTSGCASELHEQTKRLGNLVTSFRQILERTGLKSAQDEQEKAMDAPEPAEFRWTLNDANNRCRLAVNELEQLVAILDKELS